MFLTDCPACGERELRGARSIELLVNNTGHGVDAVYHCASCGHANVLRPGAGPASRSLAA